MRKPAPGVVNRRHMLRMSAAAGASVMLPCCNSPVPESGRAGATGFYHVEELNGVWWLVTPTGELQVSLGINHVQPLLLLGPYNRSATLRRYGLDFVRGGSPETKPVIENPGFELAHDFNPLGQGAQRWMSRILTDFDDWGFNALGYHTTLPRDLFRLDLAYVQAVAAVPREPYSPKAGLDVEFPDPFHPGTEQRIKDAFRPLCVDCDSDRNLIGWAFNDVPQWKIPAGGGMHPWVRALTSLQPGASGKRRWVEMLDQRHPDLQSACAAHGVQAANWGELLAITDWPECMSEAARADCAAFMLLIARQWYKVHQRVVRLCDSNHLILGDKLNGESLPDYLLPILERCVDVVCIQWYGRLEDQRDRLIEIHQKTGKPILLGDSSFSVVAEGQQGAKGVPVSTQEEVGEEYYRYLKGVMELPFVIGWHYCGYIEGRPGLGAYFPERQCGFKDPFENVHEDAIARVREANRLAWSWHAGARPYAAGT